MLIEGYTAGEALYMSVITISTVGFSEVKPLSDAGRFFTSVYVMINLGITALFLSQLTQNLSEGGLITRLYRKLMDKEIETVKNHIIVCGIGRYGHQIIELLADTDETILFIDIDEEIAEKMAAEYPDLLYIIGNATDDAILLQAGIERAKALIVTLHDDSETAFAVLSARQLAPKLTIIARAYEASSRSKLLKVGANHVIQPEQIGSFFMATLVRKPSAVEFFTSLAQGTTADVGFEEVVHESLPKEFQGCSLLEMDLRRKTGISVVAIRYPDGHYEVNPDPGTQLVEGTSFVALGDSTQLARLRKLFEKL